MNYINLTPWILVLKKTHEDQILNPTRYEMSTENNVSRITFDDGIYFFRNHIKKTISLINGRRKNDGKSMDTLDINNPAEDRIIYIVPPYFYESFNMRSDFFTFDSTCLGYETENKNLKIISDIMNRFPIEDKLPIKKLIQKAVYRAEISSFKK